MPVHPAGTPGNKPGKTGYARRVAHSWPGRRREGLPTVGLLAVNQQVWANLLGVSGVLPLPATPRLKRIPERVRARNGVK